MFPTLAPGVYTHRQMNIVTFRRSSSHWPAAIAVFALTILIVARPNVAAAQSASKELLIYAIDVEGGQATLLVAPGGHSLLVDTGWPGNNGRDAERIEAAMKDAGIAQIDKVLITHYHDDHVGGVPNLVARVKVGEFLDHGVNREEADDTRNNYSAYLKAIGNTPRRSLHPGDAIDIPGLTINVLAADGEHVDAVPGIKPAPNPYCASEPKWELDQTENPRSVGILVRFGSFRFLDLGDLTKPKEVALVCPNNPIGTVDLYLATHHGYYQSNAKAIVDAIRARAAIMDNGAHKAGSPDAWQTVHDSPDLEDLWMLHTAEGSDAAHNSAEALIANPKGDGDGHYFKVVARPDGSFSVMNSRTGQTKKYARQ